MNSFNMKVRTLSLIFILFVAILLSACSNQGNNEKPEMAEQADIATSTSLHSEYEERQKQKKRPVNRKKLRKASFSELFRRDGCKGDCEKINPCAQKSYSVTTEIKDGNFLMSPNRLFISDPNDRSEVLQIEPDTLISDKVMSYIKSNKGSTFKFTGYMIDYKAYIHDACHSGPLLLLKSANDVELIE